MNIRVAEDRTAWETFCAEAHPPTFLQSWAWGETQRALGEEVIRLEARDGNQTCGVAQAVTITARRGKFLHLPHGPVVQESMGDQGLKTAAGIPSSSASAGVESRNILEALLGALRDQATRRHLAFLRVSPIQKDTEGHRALYRQLGFRSAPIHLHAERLWILELAKSENELLHEMRKTTRNLIRRAEREGVTVRLTASRQDLPTLLRLYRETADREHFVPFSPRALEAELSAFASDGNALLAVAEYRGQPLATAMILFTPWSAFYHHGASSRAQPNVPLAYALQWAIIQEAKRRGCKEYNFWGIAPHRFHASTFPRLHTRPHPWAGLTLFKTGFGGREVPLVPTQDLPLSSRYWLTFGIDSLRRWKRDLKIL